MKTFIRLFIALYSVFHFSQCEQITSNSIEQQVEVLSGPQSLAIHNNMSVPVYYLIIEQESATRALLVFSCSAERNIAAGERKEIFYTDIQNYSPGATILVYAWQCNSSEEPDDLTIFKVETP